MKKQPRKKPGPLRRIAQAYANVQRVRQRWRRTSGLNKLVILAEGADLLIEKRRERRSTTVTEDHVHRDPRQRRV